MLSDLSRLAKCGCVNFPISFHSHNKTARYIVCSLFYRGQVTWWQRWGSTQLFPRISSLEETCSCPPLARGPVGRRKENLLAHQAKSFPRRGPLSSRLCQKLLARLRSYSQWLIFKVISSVKSSQITHLKNLLNFTEYLPTVQFFIITLGI